MHKLIWPRIALAGMMAGIVVSSTEYILGAFVFNARWEAAIKALDKPYITVNTAIALFQLLGFAAGIGAVWSYAGMSRGKPSGTKALFSAVCSWALIYGSLCLAGMVSKLVPGSLVAIVGISSVCELIAGAFVGAWIYEESRAASERAAAVT